MAQIADLEVFNHAVSAKKFRIIQMFLELGYNVLLSDIDIIVLRVLLHLISIILL